uniref:Uncharacterized protein n=1 Tax=Arundo donax TaxID=35708 RepID=A0A0A8YHL7_ARUDO
MPLEARGGGRCRAPAGPTSSLGYGEELALRRAIRSGEQLATRRWIWGGA